MMVLRATPIVALALTAVTRGDRAYRPYDMHCSRVLHTAHAAREDITHADRRFVDRRSVGAARAGRWLVSA